MELTIRAARAEDASALLAIYAPYVRDTAITFEYEIPSPETFRQRILHTLERYPYLAAETEDGKLLGYAYASPFQSRAAYDWSVETSIYVDRALRHQGLGRILYHALEQSLIRQGILNANACIAVPTAETDPYLDRNSVAFHQHLGYRMVGEFQQCGYKFGRWYNMCWMEKHLGPHLDAQPPVTPFAPAWFPMK